MQSRRVEGPARRGRRAWLGFALLVVAGGAAAQTAAPSSGTAAPPERAAAVLTEVDPALLSGGTLTLRDANFAVSAPPGTGWLWRTKRAAGVESTRLYFCANPNAGLTFSVIDSQVPKSFRLDDAVMATAGRQLVEDLQRAGRMVSNYRFERPPVPPSPMEGAFVASYQIDEPGSPATHCVSWTLWTGHEVGLVHCGAEATEPAAFGTFVRSFRALAPPAAPAPAGMSSDARIEALTKLFLWIWLIALALAEVVNRLRGGTVRIWRWSGAAVAAAAAIAIAVAFTQPGVRAMPAADAGSVVGTISMCAMPALLFNLAGTVVASRRRRARARAAQAAAGMPAPGA